MIVRVPTLCSARLPSSASSFGLDGNRLRLDRALRGIVARKSRAGRLNDGALGANDLLEHLALLRLRLADARGGQAALEDRHACTEADRRSQLPGLECPVVVSGDVVDIGLAPQPADKVGRRLGSGNVHVIAGGNRLPADGNEVGVIGERNSNRFVRRRRKRRERRRGRKYARRMADDLPVGRLARR